MRSHTIPDSLLFNVVLVNVKPHCRVALTRLQQLRSTDNLPLHEIEEACIREDEAKFARVSSSRAPVFQQTPQQTQQQCAGSQRPCPFAASHTCGENAQRKSVLAPRLVVAHVRASAIALNAFHSGNPMESSPPAHGRKAFSATSKPISVSSSRPVKISSILAASRTQLNVDKLSGNLVPSISAHIMKTNLLTSSPKQLVFEGTVNKNPITFLLDGAADHSIIFTCSAKAIGPLCNPLSPTGFHLTYKSALIGFRRIIRELIGTMDLSCFPTPTIATRGRPPTATPSSTMSPLPSVCAQQDRFGRIQQQTRPTATMYQQSRSFQRKRSPKLFLRRSRRSFKTSLTSRKSQQPSLRRGFAMPLYPDAGPIRMADGDIFKTSFSSPVGLFEWTVMLTGLISAPASFQRVMSELFKNLQFVQVYMDDIVVHSRALSGHHDHLRHVFQEFQEKAFRRNLSKCSFDADCIYFLGFQISPAGVQPLAANVSSILPMPSTFSPRTAVHRYLGMARITTPILSLYTSSPATQPFSVGAHLVDPLCRTSSTS
ncbi:hypothetical protein Efla_006971 [Eimeria flavescens]